jgi:hypothetical protein
VEAKKIRKVTGKPSAASTPSSVPDEPALVGGGPLAPLAEERPTTADVEEGPLCTSETNTVQLQQYSLVIDQVPVLV